MELLNGQVGNSASEGVPVKLGRKSHKSAVVAGLVGALAIGAAAVTIKSCGEKEGKPAYTLVIKLPDGQHKGYKPGELSDEELFGVVSDYKKSNPNGQTYRDMNGILKDGDTMYPVPDRRYNRINFRIVEEQLKKECRDAFPEMRKMMTNEAAFQREDYELFKLKYPNEYARYMKPLSQDANEDEIAQFLRFVKTLNEKRSKEVVINDCTEEALMDYIDYLKATHIPFDIYYDTKMPPEQNRVYEGEISKVKRLALSNIKSNIKDVIVYTPSADPSSHGARNAKMKGFQYRGKRFQDYQCAYTKTCPMTGK